MKDEGGVKGDRDAAIEHLLRRSSPAPKEMKQDSCPDAETLAAWMDGALAGTTLGPVEAHVADCARCQAMVAVVQRTTPHVSPPRPWWTRPWTVGWLVPVTAGIAAVAIWTAVPRQETQPRLPQTTTATAEPPVAQRSAPAELGRIQEQERPQSRDDQRPAQSVAQAPSSPGVNERDRANVVQPERRLAERVDDTVPKADASRPSAKSADTASPLPAPSAPAAASPSPSAAAELSAAGRRESARGFAPEPTVLIASPARTQWRIVNGVTIQASTDAGASWQVVNVSVPAPLRAGSAPSAAVCWIVGQGGLVFRTIDGRTWQRVPFADASDLIQVQASDGRTAQVTTADGRIFRTIDGGVSWAQPSLQEF